MKGMPFSQKEQNVLMDLVEERRGILENKETDKVSLGRKNGAWEEVANCFNARGPTSGPRTSKQLKKYVIM